MSEHRGKQIERIPEEVLAERQYRLKNRMLRELRSIYRRLEAEEGLTQRSISRRIGKDPSLVSRQLSGDVNMTIASLSDLLEGMRAELELKAVPVKELITRADKASPTKIEFQGRSHDSAQPKAGSEVNSLSFFGIVGKGENIRMPFSSNIQIQ